MCTVLPVRFAHSSMPCWQSSRSLPSALQAMARSAARAPPLKLMPVLTATVMRNAPATLLTLKTRSPSGPFFFSTRAAAPGARIRAVRPKCRPGSIIGT